MNSSIGIIGIPTIFGISQSLTNNIDELQNIGFQATTVDPFKDQQIRCPSFMEIMVNGTDKLHEVFTSLDDRLILEQISYRASQLLKKGCSKIYIFGYGLGGIYGLKACENNDNLFSGVIAWYPHLIFLKETGKNPPILEKIKVRTLLFFGERDNMLEPGTIELAKKSSSAENINIFLFPHVGHAFADAFVQGNTPNPLYNKSVATKSWHIALKWIKKNNLL